MLLIDPCDERFVRFSYCGRYRYMLRRALALHGPVIAFIMLNPSTADAVTNDPTIRWCIAFAKAWGASDLLVGNVFAWRATNPRELKDVANPFGDANTFWLERIGREAVDSGGFVVAAWGNGGALHGAGDHTKRLMRDAGIPLHALKLTKSGAPSHPLYLPRDTKPFVWSQAP